MLPARDGRKESKFVTVFQEVVRGTVFSIDDPKESDRPGNMQGKHNIVDRRMFGKVDHLLIGAELPQRGKKLDLHFHRKIIPDFPVSPKCISSAASLAEPAYDRHHTPLWQDG
jgi:hypothetical protein